MSYIHIESKKIVEVNDILTALSHVSLPNMGWDDEMLAPFGYAEIHHPGEVPETSKYETLVDGEPELKEGKWYKTFEVQSTIPADETIIPYWLEAEKNALIKQAKAFRDQVFAKGTSVNEVLVKTDAASLQALFMAYTNLKEGLIPSINWKTADGSFVELDAAAIEPIYKGAFDFVQQQFAAEMEQIEKIKAISTVEELKAF